MNVGADNILILRIVDNLDHMTHWVTENVDGLEETAVDVHVEVLTGCLETFGLQDRLDFLKFQFQVFPSFPERYQHRIVLFQRSRT